MSDMETPQVLDLEKIPTISKDEKPRFYHINWLRTIAVHLVIYVHCINMGTEQQEYYTPPAERTKEWEFEQ